MLNTLVSDCNIFRQGLESLSVGLYYCYGHVAGLARLDISHDARFACMRTTHDCACSAVFQSFIRIRLSHCYYSIILIKMLMLCTL